MKTQTVNLEKKYTIYIDNGILDRCGEFVRKVSSSNRAAIITDSNVAALYEERARVSLEKSGFTVCTHVFNAGESSKNLKTVEEILCFLAENELSRGDIIIALGGGVVGDTAGLCAALYMRGISFVQIPTTLLAQIDSSVGGKTAVDLPQGKNLCGAFYQPKSVLIDPELLSTLSPKFFADGMAEAIKYGCIRDEELFCRLEKENAKDFLEDLIDDCVNIKRVTVENDECEKGERMLLNFGHTLGHALEKYYNFEGVSHGEAVGIGMILASLAGEENGLTEKGTCERIRNLLCKYNLPVTDNAELRDILKLCVTDKKRSGDSINFVMLKKIGDSFIYPLEINKIPEFFKEISL